MTVDSCAMLHSGDGYPVVFEYSADGDIILCAVKGGPDGIVDYRMRYSWDGYPLPVNGVQYPSSCYRGVLAPRDWDAAADSYRVAENWTHSFWTGLSGGDPVNGSLHVDSWDEYYDASVTVNGARLGAVAEQLLPSWSSIMSGANNGKPDERMLRESGRVLGLLNCVVSGMGPAGLDMLTLATDMHYSREQVISICERLFRPLARLDSTRTSVAIVLRLDSVYANHDCEHGNNDGSAEPRGDTNNANNTTDNSPQNNFVSSGSRSGATNSVYWTGNSSVAGYSALVPSIPILSQDAITRLRAGGTVKYWSSTLIRTGLSGYVDGNGGLVSDSKTVRFMPNHLTVTRETGVVLDLMMNHPSESSSIVKLTKSLHQLFDDAVEWDDIPSIIFDLEDNDCLSEQGDSSLMGKALNNRRVMGELIRDALTYWNTGFQGTRGACTSSTRSMILPRSRVLDALISAMNRLSHALIEEPDEYGFMSVPIPESYEESISMAIDRLNDRFPYQRLPDDDILSSWATLPQLVLEEETRYYVYSDDPEQPVRIL